MKKVFLVCVAVIAFVAIVSAQVTVVRSTKEEYKEALYSKFLCSCRCFVNAKLSQSDNMRIDSVLKHHYFGPIGNLGSDVCFWRDSVIKQWDDIYVVEFGGEIESSGDFVALHTAFLDSLFRPLGAIDGERAVFDCCARNVATLEKDIGDVPPIIHLYKLSAGMKLPEKVGIYVPNDFLAREYCYNLGGELFVKGLELIDEVYAGDTMYIKITID